MLSSTFTIPNKEINYDPAVKNGISITIGGNGAMLIHPKFSLQGGDDVWLQNDADFTYIFGPGDTPYSAPTNYRWFGSYQPIYHNTGFIHGYWNWTGTYLDVNGIEKLYETLGFIELHQDHKVSGVFQSEGEVFAPIIYRRQAIDETERIVWLNNGGTFSNWAFRKVSESISTKRSTPVNYNASDFSTQKAIDFNVKADKVKTITFDTIAVDDCHLQLLTEIADSFVVLYQDRLCKVASATSSVNKCRNNRLFELTLTFDDYAASY
jgi:hypothetical protein